MDNRFFSGYNTGRPASEASSLSFYGDKIMEFTTLCYIRKEDSWLMLHRIKKKQDVNQGKWIGVGGHFEAGESPEECLIREVREETGLTLTQWQFRGIITFCSRAGRQEMPVCEYMCLYTADRFEGTVSDCREGVLQWIRRDQIGGLTLWEGDRIFLNLLLKDRPFFSLKLSYCEDRLEEAVLDGHPMELFDIRDEKGNCTGQTRERSIAHEDGSIHGTSHVWIVRPGGSGGFDVLLQKRSAWKDAFPGCFDISSAGHLPAGQDFLPSALRELKEELGLDAAPEDLTLIGFHDGNCVREFYGRPFRNHEISAVYVCELPVDPAALTLQREEVESVCWIPFKALRERVLAKDPLYCIYAGELDMLARFFSGLPCGSDYIVREEDPIS